MRLALPTFSSTIQIKSKQESRKEQNILPFHSTITAVLKWFYESFTFLLLFKGKEGNNFEVLERPALAMAGGPCRYEKDA